MIIFSSLQGQIIVGFSSCEYVDIRVWISYSEDRTFTQ